MTETIEIKIDTLKEIFRWFFIIGCLVGFIIFMILFKINVNQSGMSITKTGGYDPEFIFYTHTVKDIYNEIFIEDLEIELIAYMNRTEIRFINYYGEIYLEKIKIKEISYKENKLIYEGQSLKTIIFDEPTYLNGTFDFILYNNELSMIYGEEPIYNITYKIVIDYINVPDGEQLKYMIPMIVFIGLLVTYGLSRFMRFIDTY